MISLNSVSRSTKIFIALAFFYAALTFILPANATTKANYRLDDAQYQYLLFIVKLPIIAVWSLAFYSYRRLANYAQSIKDTSEGKDFTTIAKGMSWIAWGLPIPAVISSLLSALANAQADFRAVSAVIGGYLAVAVSLVAFHYFSSGTHSLVRRADVEVKIKHIRILVGALIAIGLVFVVLIFSKLHSTNLGDSFNSFYLPNWLVWSTIVGPYLYAWFLGVFAVMEFILIARQTSGVIYRQALQLLAVGLVLIILSLCALQYFRAVIPRSGHLTIGAALITTYGIYAVNALGSVVLAVGAKRLQRIEDI